MSKTTLDVIAEVLALLAAVVLLIPAFRVGNAVLSTRRLRDRLRTIPKDRASSEIIEKVSALREQESTAWRRQDHVLVIAGLAIQVVASSIKIVIAYW